MPCNMPCKVVKSYKRNKLSKYRFRTRNKFDYMALCFSMLENIFACNLLMFMCWNIDILFYEWFFLYMCRISFTKTILWHNFFAHFFIMPTCHLWIWFSNFFFQCSHVWYWGQKFSYLGENTFFKTVKSRAFLRLI